ncbi:MAG: DUF4974 domain-containing protein [Tannerella sp.]|jgi:ferric-dicitrate binding protein FerR (iron transport regulator)|nr:DUF4974 domain-containing protein [Tannerella sp.]
MDIDTLIAKYLSGESTPEETDQINQWRQSSVENEHLFRQSEESWQLFDTRHSTNHYDKERTWAGIQQQIRRQYSLSALWRVSGIAASIALLLGWALSYISTGNHHDTAVGQQQIITLYVPAGITSQAILPDSTVVWLNSSSTISYPSNFTGETRSVELIGEAFFDVTRDEKKPFIIKSGDLKVRVLGTSFNFKHYGEDTQAILAVVTGTVALSAGSVATTTLQAGKYAVVDNQTLQTEVLQIPKSGLSTWRDYKMVFRDEPIINVLNELARKYNVEFEIRDEAIKRYIYTATFDNMNLEDVLKLLKLSSPIDYKTQSLTLNTPNAYGKKQITIFQK